MRGRESDGIRNRVPIEVLFFVVVPVVGRAMCHTARSSEPQADRTSTYGAATRTTVCFSKDTALQQQLY